MKHFKTGFIWVALAISVTVAITNSAHFLLSQSKTQAWISG